MEQSLNEQKKTKIKNSKRKILDSLAENPNQIEEGLEFFDKNIPSLLKDEIDLVCLDKDHRLVVIQLAERKLAKTGSFNFFKKALYLWQWMNDFKDDFLIEAEKKTGKAPLRLPAKLIILTPDPNQTFLGFAAYVKKQVIDLDIFKLTEENDSFKFELVSLDESRLPSEDDIEEFDSDIRKRLKEQYHVWEQVTTMTPDPHGYSLDRKLITKLFKSQK